MIFKVTIIFLEHRAVGRLSNEEILGSKFHVRIKKNKPAAAQVVTNKDSNKKSATTPSKHAVNVQLAKVGKSKSMLTLASTGYQDQASAGKLQKKAQNHVNNHQPLFPFPPPHPAVASCMFRRAVQMNQQPPMLPALMNAMVIPPNQFLSQPSFASPPPPPLMHVAIRSTQPVSSSTAMSSPAQTFHKNNTTSNSNTKQQDGGGVKVLITNLDVSVDKNELQKNLTGLIKEHCKVISVSIETDLNTYHAIVNLPKQKDADSCVTKLNNHKFFSKNLSVSILSAKDLTILKNKSLVTNLLKESGWLPLDEFLLTFKECYKKAFHVLDLDQIKDVIYVDGKPGQQFICLLHYKVGMLLVKQDAGFEKEIVDIVKQHNRKIPFSRYYSIMNLFIRFFKFNFLGYLMP